MFTYCFTRTNRPKIRKGCPLTAFSPRLRRETNLNQLNLINHELAKVTSFTS